MFHIASPFVGDCDLVAGVIVADDTCREWEQIGHARALKKKAYQDPAEPKSEGG